MRRHRELQQLTIDGQPIVVATKDLQGSWGGKRKGAGRPSTGRSTKTISVRIPDTMVPLIKARSFSLGQSVSDWLIDLIKFDLQMD